MTKLLTVIPVFNGERYLYATLDSLAKQTRRPDRVIVHDNHSTDGTKQVYDAFKHLGFEWHQTPRHCHVMDNFIETLKFAHETEYFHQIASDDILLPEFFENIIPTLEKCNGYSMAYTAYEVIDENGILISEKKDHYCPVPITKDGLPRVVSLNQFLQKQADINTILMPAVLLKTAYKSSPVTFSRDFIQASDCVFYAEWATYCEKITELPKVLCRYRRHSNTTTNKNLMNPAAFIEDEWKTMVHISKMISYPWPIRWIKKQRSKCLLAARSHAKLKMFKKNGTEYANQIKITTLSYVSRIHWLLGGMAVKIRDLLQNKS